MQRDVKPILLAAAVMLSVMPSEIAAQSSTAQASLPAVPVRDFTVQDVNGHTLSYSARKGKVTVVVFISTRCPMSNAFNFRLNELYKKFASRVGFIVVNSNVNESLAEVRTHAKNMDYDFPVYKDADNAVADILGARATPDAFVIGKKGTIEYHGYIEDAPNPERSRNHALRNALEEVLADKPVSMPETHSLGCVIRRARTTD